MIEDINYSKPLSAEFFDCAEGALLIDFGPSYNTDLSLAILDLGASLAALELSGIKESVPALSSLTVFYDPLELSREDLVAEIKSFCKSGHSSAVAGRDWEIPVIYGGKRGPDLGEVARAVSVTADAVINLHTSTFYHVYMLGFLPGFAYLGDLPEPLHLPRRAVPRSNVPAGSVAIAANMTAIYPLESPGGWHVIGYTPIVLWDMAASDRPLLAPGDRVRFAPISESEAVAGCHPRLLEKA
ncbi:MAG: 5-oxoprolinase subunit PxpB [Rhodomicrobium sp.]